MTSLITVAANFTRPGTYLVENTLGGRIPEIASHSTIYMHGSSSLGFFDTPTQVVSFEDFTNQFGASPSENYVKSLFREFSQAILYFSRVGLRDYANIQVDSAATGTINLTINSVPLAVVVSAGATIASVATSILNAINTTTATAAIVTAYSTPDPSVIRVIMDTPGSTLTITESSANISVTDFVPTVPTALDFVQSIENSYSKDEGWNQGFLIVPEAFGTLTVATDRLAVANAMISLVSSEGFDWIAAIDNHSSVDSVSKLITDKAQYSSPIGHATYFAPWVTTLEDVSIPFSPVAIASYVKKISKEGFQEPIGGTRYALKSIKGFAQEYNNQQQSQLNPLGINLGRNLKRNGLCVYGMRSASTDSSYKFMHVRVIMNVINGTLRSAFDSFPFSSIDGQGTLLHRIQETAHSVGLRLWLGKALFGGTAEDAFLAKCDFENNNSADLQNGIVYLQFFGVPVPGAERILIGTYRVNIGGIPDVAFN